MACKKMLVLLGDTYRHRLWCVWELFTLFSFQSEKKAHAKIVIADLTAIERESSDAGGDLIDREAKSGLSTLQTFELSSAHTYDPNEEKKILAVVRAVGEAKFEEAIHKLGRLRLEHKGHERTGSSRSGAVSSRNMAR